MLKGYALTDIENTVKATKPVSVKDRVKIICLGTGFNLSFIENNYTNLYEEIQKYRNFLDADERGYSG